MTPDTPRPIRAAPAGETAILLQLADELGGAATARVLGLTAALDAAQLPGVIDLVPGYTTLLVVFDPERTTPEEIVSEAQRLLASIDSAEPPAGRLVTIPVSYSGEHAPDLRDVATRLGLSESAVVDRHSGAEYRVACLGFVPGFAYLVGLPAELTVPRLPSPRPRVPVGSVGIGGAQTGVYAAPTPGGWNLIGRSPVRPFDPNRDEPFLLATGDRVRFRPVNAAEYDEIERNEESARLPRIDPGDTETVTSRPRASIGSPTSNPRGSSIQPAAIQVLTPGLLTTVQDLGRPHQLRHGVSLGGALDRGALILGNRLVGNALSAAGLEVTLSGPRLLFNQSCIVALTGADLGATLNGARMPRWEPVAIPAGGVLEFRAELADERGARAYLCLAGGIDLPSVLHSRSTDLSSAFGGLDGRALRAGDRLPIGRPAGLADALLGRRLTAPLPNYPAEIGIRVILGPQRDRFTSEGIDHLLTGSFRVSSRSDRMGARLADGPPVSHAGDADLISEGIVPGSIQVPGDAQPIVLLAACATMGGYPKIATVIDADLDRLAQARPGNRLRFTAISRDDALVLAQERRAALAEGIVDSTSRRQWTPLPVRRAQGGRQASVSDSVVQLVDTLHKLHLRNARVEVRAGDQHVRLAIRRRGHE